MSDDGRRTEKLVTATDAGAVELVAGEVAERLAGVCAGWPADRFRGLVLDVALLRLRYGIPRTEYESMRRASALRRAALHHPAADRKRAAPGAAVRPAAAAPAADVTPPPVAPPPGMRGFPAVPDRPSTAPT